MIHLHSLDQLRFQRDAEHLHRLGARALAEAFTEVARRIGGAPAIASVLADYRRLSPPMMHATDGDCFPRRPLRLVPRQSHVADPRLTGTKPEALS